MLSLLFSHLVSTKSQSFFCVAFLFLLSSTAYHFLFRNFRGNMFRLISFSALSKTILCVPVCMSVSLKGRERERLIQRSHATQHDESIRTRAFFWGSISLLICRFCSDGRMQFCLSESTDVFFEICFGIRRLLCFLEAIFLVVT